LNLTSLDFDINKINQLLTDQHSKVTLNKLQHLSTQEHDNKLFFLCTKFANVRKLLLKKLNIKLQDLCPSEYMKTITRLLNKNMKLRQKNIFLYVFPDV
jgi:hypothetical protein